ncbi:hypothetical protein FGIG_10618 [Fasciola gigantica]|uniref:Uncharacterized protein n=1 Tax=Fasciola gigantica TaxID=46835 RepID=A0A504Z9X0_FASGI|nr:hypothetical protein FGIG_10618 [Fasciola gigantica]
MKLNEYGVCCDFGGRVCISVQCYHGQWTIDSTSGISACRMADEQYYLGGYFVSQGINDILFSFTLIVFHHIHFVIEAMSITNAVAKENEDSGDRVDEYQVEATDDDQIGIGKQDQLRTS